MTAPTGDPTATTSTEPTTDPQGDPADLGDGGKKALAAERRRASDAESASKAKDARIAELEAASLSELEKAQRTAAEFQAQAESATQEALRWRIAAKHGISDDDADTFLTGRDEESLTRQAERLAAMTTASTAPTIPRPDPSQGAGAGLALNGDPLLNDLKQKLGIT